MKKFLSLVLALTMALSLVTVSAGATDFDDDGDITYQEAVTVIAGMGIVDGYSDGSFRPDDVLTRGAAAKIICNLILGPTTADALSASSAPFVDVPTTNTFAGYITYCSQQGIISGYADGTFRPTDTLSGNAFMKMLLGALGYDSDKEGYTGANWTVNVIKQAVGIELNDGNDDFVGSQAVTRQEACLYAFNTLKATMVEYSDNSTVTVGDITISSQGDYSDVSNSTSSDGNIEDDGLMQFAERYFRDLEAEDDTDDFGRPATTWTYDGDELGTYANDADATYVVGDTDDDLATLVTDDACLDYSASDVLSNADVFYNGKDLGTYSSNRDDYPAGKGDIIEAYENDDNEVDTIVIRSYTYAKIDTVDEDLSSTHENNGASVALELVDIDDSSLGTWYDNYDDSDEVLTGYNSNYTEGTVLAVAISADDSDVILDSHIMESVTGTPSAARAVETYSTDKTDKASQVTNGTITIDGTRYEYAGQMTGLGDTDNVDFDEEYTIYLTAESYVLAVDGDASASLDDVYYVNMVYSETTGGRTRYYAEAVSLVDGSEVDLRLANSSVILDNDGDHSLADDDFFYVNDLYILEEDDDEYDGEAYRGQDGYSVTMGPLSDDVTSSSSTIRLDSANTLTYDDEDEIDDVTRLYLDDETTTSIGIDQAHTDDSLDVSFSTGPMAAKAYDADGSGSSVDLTVFVIFKDDDRDAVYVVYAAENLKGGASSSDVVYLADDANNAVGSGNYEVDLYFMEDMSLVEDLTIDAKEDQGFYDYEVDEDGVYSLGTGSIEFISGDVDDDTDDEAAMGVVFDEVRSYLASGASADSDGDDSDGSTSATFDAISFADAVVIDTRSSSARNDDIYDNEINTASKLSTAIERAVDAGGTLTADVYVQDGEIVFVAVTAMTNDDGRDETIVDADYEFNTLRATISSTGGSSNYDTITFSSAVCNSIAGWDLNDVGVEYEVSVDGTRIDTVTGSLGDDLDDVTDLASSSTMKITGLAISSGSHTITVDVVVSFTGDNGADYTVSGTATIRTA
nr:S-layer homology domain-containing protein [uncultured Oscillibacter sp.]